ncbi:zinc ribbon domain-containing protein, partial [Paraliomyxa miuraensis]
MKKRAARKSARGGRALLTGELRCGRCGRMLRVVYGSAAGHAHQYFCKGADMRGARGLCLRIGGVRVDKAVAEQLLAAVAPYAVEAAILAEEKASAINSDRTTALERELEDARYDVTLARRRYDAVDPDKRLVARELEARWEAALERVQQTEAKLQELRRHSELAPKVERADLMALSHDLPEVWNSPAADMRLKQRVVRALVEEIIVDVDVERGEVALVIHWVGGRHTEVRVRRNKGVGFPAAKKSQAVRVIRLMVARWSDHEIAVSLNRMRCPAPDGSTWTKCRVQEVRQRLRLPEYDPSTSPRPKTSACGRQSARSRRRAAERVSPLPKPG